MLCLISELKGCVQTLTSLSTALYPGSSGTKRGGGGRGEGARGTVSSTPVHL